MLLFHVKIKVFSFDDHDSWSTTKEAREVFICAVISFFLAIHSLFDFVLGRGSCGWSRNCAGT